MTAPKQDPKAVQPNQHEIGLPRQDDGKASHQNDGWKLVLRGNLEDVRQRIDRATELAGRSAGSVRLMAVTKRVSASVARELVELGICDLGENRVDHLLVLSTALKDLPVRWHFIGHLQRNKLRRVLPVLDALHSLDSSALCELLSQSEAGRALRLYLQIKWTEADRKTGLEPGDVASLLRQAEAADLQVAGLMSMGVHADPVETNRIFGSTAALARELETVDEGAKSRDQLELSMGMSGDLEAAIQHGADLVRIGSDLFRGIDLESLAALDASALNTPPSGSEASSQ